MQNKIGLCEDSFEKIERQIINLKLNLLNEYFTFNKDKIDFEYLVKLHEFLFSDLYEKIGLRNLELSETDYIKYMLYSLINYCYLKDIDSVLNTLKEIWNLQPFINGNTRTFLALLKILNTAYNLNLNIDFNKEIESKPSTFNINNFVNQKRLTKIK